MLNNKIKIRNATSADLDGIVSLSEKMADFHCALDPYYGIYRKYDDSKEFYKDELTKKDRLYVVAEDENGALVGFASANLISMPNTPAPAIGKLIANFVLEEYRGQGIGTAFHEKRMEWFKANNVKYVEMSVDARNEKALKLWRKFGFKDYQYVLKKDL